MSFLNPRWNYFLTSVIYSLLKSLPYIHTHHLLLEETTDKEYHESKMSWISGNDS